MSSDKVKKIKKSKKKNEKAYPQKNKPSKIMRGFLVFLQAVLGTSLGICFFIYNIISEISTVGEEFNIKRNASFYDVSRDYFESENYIENLSNSVSTIIRYVAIREQLEENGAYAPDKIVDVGVYANRYSDIPYEGPSVCYYLDDLIKWGQKASAESFSFLTYEFYTLDEYCDFFNIDKSTVEIDEDYQDDQPFISFETLKNIYTTVDGLNAEDYALNESEYKLIINNIQRSVSDIYINYVEYLRYNSSFSETNSNLRYCIRVTENGVRRTYTNVMAFYKGIQDKYIDEHFYDYGQYLIACPGKIDYDTNTKVPYNVIKKSIVEDYAYCFSDDTTVWVAIDTDFPVSDIFSINKAAFERTANMIPWLVLAGAISLVLFVTIFALIIYKDKMYYAVAENRQNLGSFDKLPIEITVLSAVLLVLTLFLIENQFFDRFSFADMPDNPMIYVPTASIIVVDLFIALLFLYGFIRRVICKNVFEGSISSMISPKLSKHTYAIKKWFWRVYDSSGVAIRTWTSYILFLLVNCFFTCVIFFSRYKFISFIILFLIDAGVGAALFNRNYERKQIVLGIRKISGGDYSFKIDTSKMHGDNKNFADAVNDIGLGLSKALEISTKDEKLKADLITNVSHDIKTPLTSIINYVDLLKRENIDNERVKKYIGILDEKSQRLKQLTFDLVEASKISSGNISIDLIKVDFCEFIKQAVGEFEDKFLKCELDLVVNIPNTPSYAMMDPRHMWRVVENILNNTCKYAMKGTRVYLDLYKSGNENEEKLVLSLKNVSSQQLNIPAEELTERFIRGDVSRSTEGSGLGLSIAKNLTLAQNGLFDIYLDGDLFKVTISLDAK